MVREWGMSSQVGLRFVERDGGALRPGSPRGPDTVTLIDAEIKRILEVNTKT